MNAHGFEIWCATNKFTQRKVAEELGITPNTITIYKRNNHFPKWFPLALKTLEAK